jgi:hypothetical protein
MAMRSWLIWTAGFLAFPLGGIVGGSVDTPLAALIGGVLAGAVIGIGQSLASSGRLDWRRWVPATALGHGLGLLLGAVAVGFATSLGALALMGAVTGLVLGGAQALVLPARARHRLAWAAAIPALWALGWTVTTLVGVDVKAHYAVFGSTGAITFSALSGALLHLLVPVGTTIGVRTRIGDLA